MLRPAPRTLYGLGEAIGYRPLRRAIAEYLGAARGVKGSADQILITSGARQALDLGVRLLIDPGDAAWVEDQGYPGMVSVLRAAGRRYRPPLLHFQHAERVTLICAIHIRDAKHIFAGNPGCQCLLLSPRTGHGTKPCHRFLV